MGLHTCTAVAHSLCVSWAFLLYHYVRMSVVQQQTKIEQLYNNNNNTKFAQTYLFLLHKVYFCHSSSMVSFQPGNRMHRSSCIQQECTMQISTFNIGLEQYLAESNLYSWRHSQLWKKCLEKNHCIYTINNTTNKKYK